LPSYCLDIKLQFDDPKLPQQVWIIKLLIIRISIIHISSLDFDTVVWQRAQRCYSVYTFVPCRFVKDEFDDPDIADGPPGCRAQSLRVASSGQSRDVLDKSALYIKV